MAFISEPTILAASAYNKFLIDHDATEASCTAGLKTNYVTDLANVLRKHQFQDDLEIHLLHRHFLLQDGEAMVHTEITSPSIEDESASLHFDIAKAMKCPAEASDHLLPVMWYSAGNDTLVPYEYAINSPQHANRRVVTRISSEKLAAFAKEFSACVWEAGLQNLVSLKDKSCLAGAEYVAPEFRSLFRVPASIIKLQPGSGVIETGWTMDRDDALTIMSGAAIVTPSPDAPFPQPTDGHVTKTRKTTAGTVATYHETTEDGIEAFNPLEISPAYTDKMWAAVKTSTLEDWSKVAIPTMAY